MHAQKACSGGARPAGPANLAVPALTEHALISRPAPTYALLLCASWQ